MKRHLSPPCLQSTQCVVADTAARYSNSWRSRTEVVYELNRDFTIEEFENEFNTKYFPQVVHRDKVIGGAAETVEYFKEKILSESKLNNDIHTNRGVEFILNGGKRKEQPKTFQLMFGKMVRFLNGKFIFTLNLTGLQER